jgi:hypothetical protein
MLLGPGRSAIEHLRIMPAAAGISRRRPAQVLILGEPLNGLNPDGIRWMRVDVFSGQVCASKTSTSHRATPLRLTRESAVIKETWRASARATY